MITNSFRACLRAFALLTLVLLGRLGADSAQAQEDPAAPVVSAAGLASEQSEAAYGPGVQVLVISAEEFSGKTLHTAPDLERDLAGYYRSFGDPDSPAHYHAAVSIPAGGRITGVQCLVRDHHQVIDVGVALTKYQHDTSNNSTTIFTLASFATSGSSGGQQISSSLDHTVRYNEGSYRNVYKLSVGLAPTLYLRDCRITWRRQVSPAPANASFSDVPVGDFRRQFVEALFAAGITTGCQHGLFCPDAFITRGEMAVFLAVALGLHFPY